MSRILPLVLAAALAAGGGVAWHQSGRHAQANTPATAPPPMPVPVAPVLVRDMAETAEFTGFLAAARGVELRPRVGGMIEAVEVPEGGLVEPGQVLFRLDQRPYRATLARAKAALAEARERHALAGRQHARTRSLAGEGFAPRERLDQQAAEREVLAAQVQAAEAAVAAAQLDLDFTTITAPIAGRVGRALVTEGNLVAGAETPAPTLLTSIVSVDPIHVMFDVDEPAYLRLRAATAEAGDAPIEVEIGLAGEAGFSRRGRVDFLDNHVDRASGSARLRAVLPNPDGRLAPGLFARVRVPLSTHRPTVLVSEAAIGAAQGGRYVLIASPEGIAALRPVRLGPAAGDGLRVVREGLAPGERVVARGMVRPGTRIAPLPASVASNAQEPRS
jgi:gold/copper resistance efflux system membrane fusion protein